MPLLVPCPTCGQPSLFNPVNLYRPFCCKRCKLIDLGQWASESYSVPTDETLEPDGLPTEPDNNP